MYCYHHTLAPSVEVLKKGDISKCREKWTGERMIWTNSKENGDILFLHQCVEEVDWENVSNVAVGLKFREVGRGEIIKS